MLLRLRLCSLGRHAASSALDAAALDVATLRCLGIKTLDLHGQALCSQTWQAPHCRQASNSASSRSMDSHPASVGHESSSPGGCDASSWVQPNSHAGHQRQLSGSMASSSYSTNSCNSTSSTNSITQGWWQRHERTTSTLSNASRSCQHESMGPWDSAGARRGLISHALAPKPLPRYRKVDKDFRWKRMVIRIPSQVTTELQGSYLTLAGQAGSIRVNLGHMDPTGLLGMQLWQQQQQQQQKGAGSSASGSSDAAADAQGGSGDAGALLLCVSPSKRCFRGIATHIDNAVTGVTQGFLVGLTVKGVGYRLEPAEQLAPRRRWYFDRAPAEKTAVAYPYKQAAAGVRLKVGYSYTAVFPLPEGVRAFFIRPNLMYLYGVELSKVRNTAMAIRKVRPPNTYTGNGIQLVDEVVKLRPRGGSR